MKPLATRQKRERGAAILLSLFAVLLLSAIGVFMYVSSDTETHIDSNYRSGVSAYYGARFGLEEVRDRIRYLSLDFSPTKGVAYGIVDKLPQAIAGDTNGVLYILNDNVNMIDPTDPNGPYFDDQLCHDYNSGTDKYTKCSTAPSGNWLRPYLHSVAAPGAAGSFKWARINIKTNRIADPYFVNGPLLGPSTLDVPICWDGVTEQILPSGTTPYCDANGMQTVYMVTALATTPGVSRNSSRKMLRMELAAPFIRPAGAITLDASNAVTQINNNGFPTTHVDGRNHNPDGSLPPTNNRCSNVSALAVTTDSVRTSLRSSLDLVRQDIVNQANTLCNYTNGSSMVAGKTCSPGLWWVRGTDQTPRFGSITISVSSSGSGSGDHHDGHDGGSSGSGSSTITLTGAPSSALDLTAPELLATSAVYAPGIPTVTKPDSLTAPFTGGSQTPSDPSYQPSSASVLPDSFTAIRALVASAAQQPNYISVPAGGILNASYGRIDSPVVLVINDLVNGLSLQNSSLTGYGVLVVPSSLQLASATLNWTGIVLVQGDSAQLSMDQTSSASITGAVMVQAKNPTQSLTLQTGQANSFNVNYSCDAVDMAFGALPFKVISSSEFN